jgi:hypothetical protein
LTASKTATTISIQYSYFVSPAQIYGLSALVLALTAAASALKVFGPEKLVFYRENASGASALAYFTGKDFAQLPVLLALPLFFTGILYTLLTPRANFFDLYLAYFLTCYCSYSIGYFVSVIVKPSIAQVASVVAILICMVFSGTIHIRNLTKKWI